jgi:hypothetical protein
MMLILGINGQENWWAIIVIIDYFYMFSKIDEIINNE